MVFYSYSLLCRESTDQSLEKEFIEPDEDGNASSDNEDAEDTESQGSRPKRARMAPSEPSEPQPTPCLYCGGIFKGEKGILRHEKFCAKKKQMSG